MVAPNESEERSRSLAWLDASLVFVAALALRYALVFELRTHSYAGNIRVSDAGTYFQLAQQIVSGSAAFEPYWQAPLYPLLLAGFQAIFGNALHAVQWLHMAIGALNCVLLFRLSGMLFGARVAFVAASIAVFYGPFLLFDVQPLPANVTMLLDLLLVLSYLHFRQRGGLTWLAGAGSLLGAAIVTHGLAIFTLPVFLYDLALRQDAKPWQVQRDRSARHTVFCLSTFLVAVLIAPAAVSVRNSLAAGTPVFISYNAGINLYVGNHHDLEQTLGRRGGYEWGELFRDPYTHGAKQPAAMNRFFLDRALEQWRAYPGGMLMTLGKKFLMSLAGDELKRNFPIYPLRESSWVLSALLWEAKVSDFVLFAFPAGLMIPLAALGFWALRRGSIETRVSIARASLPAWIAIFHMLGMLVFFPTARYRLPAMILLFPFAAAMMVAIWDRIYRGWRGWPLSKSRRAKMSVGAIVAGLLLILVNPVASNVFRHPVKNRAEQLYFGALWAVGKLHRYPQASLETRMLAQANEAIRIDPAYPEPEELLGVYYLRRDIDRSLVYFARLNELVPNDQTVLVQLRAARTIRDQKQP